MKLIVERSGGFAGAIRRGEEDEAALTAEQQKDLRALLDGGVEEAPESPGAADRFVYKIEVQGGAGARSLTVPEAQMPPSLAAIATRPR